MKRLIIKQVMKISILFGLFFFTGLNTAQNIPVTTMDPLCLSLQASGAELSRAHIIGKAKILMDGNRPKRMLDEIGKALRLDVRNAVIEEQNSTYQNIWKLSYDDAERQIVASIHRRDEKKNEAELTIYHIQKNPLYTDIVPWRAAILEILKKFHATPQITTCLEGYLDGKLRKGMWEGCLADAFAAIGAKKVGGTRNDHYASYIGYSPLLTERFMMATQQVNVNIAMRYHSFDDRTYVIVGSPIIAIDY